jgi:hypothetical protein
LKHPLSIDQLQAAQSEITGKGKEMPSAGGSFAVLETLQNLLKYPEVPDHLLVMKGKVAAGQLTHGTSGSQHLCKISRQVQCDRPLTICLLLTAPLELMNSSTDFFTPHPQAFL